MFQSLIVKKACDAIELFAQCVRRELDKAGTPVEMRQDLAVIMDNALICYQQQKGNDPTTVAVVSAMRPRLKAWIK